MRIFIGVALALGAACSVAACHSSGSNDNCAEPTRPNDYELTVPLPSACDIDGGDGGIACTPSCPQDCPQPTILYTAANTCAVVAADGGGGLVFACTYKALPLDVDCN